MTARRTALAVLIATGVVAVAAGSGATAATLITSKQIKDGTIVSADVKNGALLGADLADGTVKSADIGNGTVAPGDLGPSLRSSLAGGRIPSGVTVTGVAYLDVQTATAGDFAFSVNLPGRATTSLEGSTVNFSADGDTRTLEDDPECTGTNSVPTAPAGKVCLYLRNAAGDSTNISATGDGPSSFLVMWNDDASSADAYVNAVWAYTAP